VFNTVNTEYHPYIVYNTHSEVLSESKTE